MDNDRAEKGTLGSRLKEARIDKKWSQEALASRCGLTKKAVSKIERGDTKSPSAINLARLATALNMSVNYLLTGSGQKQPAWGVNLEMIDHDILGALEWLTEAQKEELYKQLKEKADQNRQAVEAYQKRIKA